MTEFAMHYIGKGLYSAAQFEAESEKHGVARALPARIVKTLVWGQPILLSQWLPDHEAQKATMTFQQDLEGDSRRGMTGIRFKRIGSAEVFGFFRIVGLNMDGTPEMKDELLSQLNVVRTVDYPGGMRVSRRCGGYGIGSTSFVTDTIEEILAKAEPIQEKHGFKFRWFVTGKFERVSPELLLAPAQFSRGITKVEIDGFNLSAREMSEEGEEHAMNFLLDYERRTYVKKGDEQ